MRRPYIYILHAGELSWFAHWDFQRAERQQDMPEKEEKDVVDTTEHGEDSGNETGSDATR